MDPLINYDELIELVEDEDVSPKEAERLAAKFWRATYFCNKDIKRAKKETILTEEVKALQYNEAIKNTPGNKITEKKIDADTNTEYRKAVKLHEEAVEEYEYYKRLFKVLENGHIFYKLLSRET